MKIMKKLFSSLTASFVILSMMMSGVNATSPSRFVQNTQTNNTYGYVDYETDQFETYTTVAGSAGNYTSLSSKIYKPVSGDTLIVCFHGNGEGGVEGACNNYAPLAGNQMATTFIASEVQKSYKGAYVLAFQAPDYWYNDYTAQAKRIIDQAKEEFGINQIFVTGLSAGGLMTERMLAKYGNYFSGALISCAAIAKNGQYVEGLGGDYSLDYSQDENFINADLKLQKPSDYDKYVENYNNWLIQMAESNVPMYLVHCTKDNTISVTWSQMAYNKIKEYRKDNQLSGDIYFQTIDSTGINQDTGAEMSGHWAWVKMYNNEISVDGLSTMDWFTGLSASTNTYQEKSFALPTAGASDEENTFKFNLIAQVRDDGEKVIAIEIDMNNQKVDSSKLTKDMFVVKAYNSDAQSELGSTVNYGLFGSEDEPVDIVVDSVTVNEKGNILLSLETKKAVLNWSGDLSRNLATHMRYSIEAVELPVVVSQDTNTNAGQSTNQPAKSVQTGDNSQVMLFSSIIVLSAAAFIAIKKYVH